MLITIFYVLISRRRESCGSWEEIRGERALLRGIRRWSGGCRARGLSGEIRKWGRREDGGAGEKTGVGERAVSARGGN